MTYIGHKEGDNATEYYLQGNVFRDTGDDIHIETNRRGDQPYLTHPDDEYAEPYGVKTQRQNYGKEYGGDEQH